MKTAIFARVVFLNVILASLVLAQYPQMDFPLQIGNRWQYSEMPGYYSESRAIRDTLMINGLTYTQIQGELFGGYFRKDSTKIFSYNTSSNDESLVYDFSKKLGDTLFVQVNGIDTVVKTIYEEGSGIVFGQERHYMAFLTKDSRSTNYSMAYVRDGLGLSSYNGELLSYGLVGALINGIQYGVILSVHNSDNTFPMKYQIFQNYPNPFNPETMISFTLSKSEYVSIHIYDQLGRQVTTLLSRSLMAGLHSIKWSAQDLPSGVYFYRAQIGNSVECKQMILLK